MRARQIEVFRTVMRCGTLTSAARLLNVSQPALSQILQHTEDELGFKLFDRTKGRLIPTPEAEELFPEANRLFEDLENLRHAARDLKRGKLRTVRLAASAPASLAIVPDALQSFRVRNPEVRLLSYVVPAEAIMTMLEQGQAGLGLAMTDRVAPAIDAEVIGCCNIVCVVPTGHRLAGRAGLTSGDLTDETVISYRSNSLPGVLLERALAVQGERLRVAIEIEISIIALAFVQQGLGVALVDALLPWERFPGVVVIPFSPAVSLPIALLTSARRPISRHHDLLRQELRRAVAAHRVGGGSRP
jgi:DNA-binding transcriptional LysR family regulator